MREAKSGDILLLTLLGLIWGSSFFNIKIATYSYEPFTLALIRVIFASLPLLILCRYKKIKVLAFSEKISRFLLKFSFFEDSKCIFSDSLFPNDYLTFETDDEEIKIIANKKKGKKQIQIHSYLLDHQLFHQIIHSRTNCISDYSLSRVF